MDIFKRCHNDKLVKEARMAKRMGLYPFFIALDENRGSKAVINGKEVIMIGSNNYLGLSLDPRVKEAALDAIKKFGTSCSGSRFLNGTLILHEELEHKLAKFVGKEEALCFSTGYQTNLGAISALVKSGDHIFTDRYNHASIWDGIFLATGLKGKLKVHRYRHNNPVSLEKALQGVPKDEPKIIVTDGVFSMEGDIVKLPEMKRLADKFKARIYLDEAHAIGVVGKTGKGTEEHYGVKDYADIIMCTFSKSFASLGGFIAGKKDIIDYIKHYSRPLIFSASMPPASIAAVAKALEIIKQEPQRIQRLQQIGQKMIKGFSEMGYDTDVTETPIVPLVIGKLEKTLKLWKALLKNGVYANTVLTPAVPPDKTLIRTSYMAIHTDEELDKVLGIAEQIGKKQGLI